MCLFYKPAGVTMPPIKASFNQRFKHGIGGGCGSCLFLPCKSHFDVRNLKSLNWLKKCQNNGKVNIHFIKIIYFYANFSCPIYGKKSFQRNFLHLQLLKNLYEQCLSMESLLEQSQNEFAKL